MASAKTIAVIGTMDTKGEEHQYVADKIKSLGFNTVIIDVVSLNLPEITVDIDRDELSKVSEIDLEEVHKQKDRGKSVEASGRAAAWGAGAAGAR